MDTLTTADALKEGRVGRKHGICIFITRLALPTVAPQHDVVVEYRGV